LFYFDAESNTQIQELLPTAVDLKTYSLRHFSEKGGSNLKSECQGLGQSLGSWLQEFHLWSSLPEQAQLKVTLKANHSMQGLKNMINYHHWLTEAVDRFPSILGSARELFDQVRIMTQAELKDESQLHVIHGDFWTGK
jgi:hypothetical protein